MWPKRFKLENLVMNTFVFDPQFGWGRVIRKDTTDLTFRVLFDDVNDKVWYTEKGIVCNTENIGPSLFTKEDCPSFYLSVCPPPPLKKKVKKTKVVYHNVWSSGVTCHESYALAIEEVNKFRDDVFFNVVAIRSSLEWEEEEEYV